MPASFCFPLNIVVFPADSASSSKTRATLDWSDASFSLSDSSDTTHDDNSIRPKAAKRWGKAKVDSSFREQLDKER